MAAFSPLLLAVIVTDRGLGRALGYLGQPPVIGEIVADILLGPSLLLPAFFAYTGMRTRLLFQSRVQGL